MSENKSKKVKDYFESLSDNLMNELGSGESLTLNLHGEETQFIRFNHSKVRQATDVQQYNLSMVFTKNNKKLSRQVNLIFDKDKDTELCRDGIKTCQKQVDKLPEFISVVEPQSGESSEQILSSSGADGFELMEEVLSPMQDVDMAGIFSSGPVYSGVTNSKGLKHWFSNNSFYLDYSLYSAKQKAVKSCYAGNTWDKQKYLVNVNTSKELLEKMNLPVVEVPKGKHRVYLSPGAVSEITQTMAWGGFSMSAYKQGYSPFKKLKEGDEVLSDKLNLQENFELGLSPKFNSLGEVSAPMINLVTNGKLENFLVSSETAKEYDLETNYSNSYEMPRSLIIQPGEVKSDNILSELGTGIYICNLHYLNWSDRMSARITGMTRFACLWVEGGQIKGPIKDLRFDESLYNCFGKNLTALTAESEVIPVTMSYSKKYIGGQCVPGMFVNDFNFTL